MLIKEDKIIYNIQKEHVTDDTGTCVKCPMYMCQMTHVGFLVSVDRIGGVGRIDRIGGVGRIGRVVSNGNKQWK